MDEESTSWIRRAKFSHTKLPRSYSSREPSNLITIQSNSNPNLKIKGSGSIWSSGVSSLPMPSIPSSYQPKSSRPELKKEEFISELKPRCSTLDSFTLSSQSTRFDHDQWPKTKRLGGSNSSTSALISSPKPNPETTIDSSDFSFYPDNGSESNDKCSDPTIAPTNENGRNSKPKRRSLSPLPTSILSDAFKEARSISKRFSTPPPIRRSTTPPPNGKEPGNQKSRRSTSPLPSEMNHLRQLHLTTSSEKLKTKKGTSWAKYFDHGGGKVTAVETIDEWLVDRSELYLGQRFACGAHSRLYHGFYKERPVAVKIIRQPDDDENGAMAARLEKQFIREVTLLSHLHHHNVIKLAGALREPPLFLIITEYLSGGSLRAFLHRLEHKSLPLPKLAEIALDIARAMEYIHSQGVIHRDLKPENIIFDEDFCVKVVDYGIACEEAYCDALAEDPGTYRWMAPEMIKHKAYGRKVDVYSFGLLLWEMVTGTIPYEDMTPMQAAFAVVDKDLRPVIPTDCPLLLRDLIELCWSSNPEERPEFWQIAKVLEQFKAAISSGPQAAITALDQNA